jgi:hypothetical protein
MVLVVEVYHIISQCLRRQGARDGGVVDGGGGVEDVEGGDDFCACVIHKGEVAHLDFAIESC